MKILGFDRLDVAGAAVRSETKLGEASLPRESTMRPPAYAVLSSGARTLLAMVLLLHALPAWGAVEEVRVHVKGLACPFCVFGVEKGLEKLPGANSVETTIRTGVIRMGMDTSALLDPGGVREAVVRSGFSLEFLEATVTGRLVEDEGRPALRVEPSGQLLLLVEDGQDGTSRPLSEETRRQMKSLSEGGAPTLRVSGRVHDHAGFPPSVAVGRFEVAK